MTFPPELLTEVALSGSLAMLKRTARVTSRTGVHPQIVTLIRLPRFLSGPAVWMSEEKTKNRVLKINFDMGIELSFDMNACFCTKSKLKI